MNDKWAIGDPHALITVSITYCTDEEGVDVSDMARPHLERWMRENGYIHRDQALREQLAHTPPPFVPVVGDVA